MSPPSATSPRGTESGVGGPTTGAMTRRSDTASPAVKATAEADEPIALHTRSKVRARRQQQQQLQQLPRPAPTESPRRRSSGKPPLPPTTTTTPSASEPPATPIPQRPPHLWAALPQQVATPAPHFHFGAHAQADAPSTRQKQWRNEEEGKEEEAEGEGEEEEMHTPVGEELPKQAGVMRTPEPDDGHPRRTTPECPPSPKEGRKAAGAAAWMPAGRGGFGGAAHSFAYPGTDTGAPPSLPPSPLAAIPEEGNVASPEPRPFPGDAADVAVAPCAALPAASYTSFALKMLGATTTSAAQSQSQSQTKGRERAIRTRRRFSASNGLMRHNPYFRKPVATASAAAAARRKREGRRLGSIVLMDAVRTRGSMARTESETADAHGPLPSLGSDWCASFNAGAPSASGMDLDRTGTTPPRPPPRGLENVAPHVRSLVGQPPPPSPLGQASIAAVPGTPLPPTAMGPAEDLTHSLQRSMNMGGAGAGQGLMHRPKSFESPVPLERPSRCARPVPAGDLTCT